VLSAFWHCRAVLRNTEGQEHLTKLTTQLAASLQLGIRSDDSGSDDSGSESSHRSQGPEGLVPLATAHHLPLITAYRPLLFYLLTETAAAFSHIVLTLTLGFTSVSTSAHATFYVRPGKNNNSSACSQTGVCLQNVDCF
jgi:hypothetical protein